jgi:hypothetical protein
VQLLYSLLCITDWEEGHLAETEVLDQWLPPSAVGISDVASDSPSPPALPIGQPMELAAAPLPPAQQQHYPPPIQQQLLHQQNRHAQQLSGHRPPLLSTYLTPAMSQVSNSINEGAAGFAAGPPIPAAATVNNSGFPVGQRLSRDDADMAAWLMDYPYPSESWPPI